MANFTVRAGSTWEFETTLIDRNGDPITTLTNAWVSLYKNKNDIEFDLAYADPEVTLVDNVLVTVFAPEDTQLVNAGAYSLSVKIEQPGGKETEYPADVVTVLSDSPLHDNH